MPEDSSPRARRRWTLAALVTAAIAAVASTWPLATALRTAVPTHEWHCLGRGCEDEFLCVWIVTAMGKRLLHAPLALFEGGILAPLRHTLGFSETMLSAVAVTAPFTWITGEAVLAYDLHYLATVALSVLGTFLLVREITGDARAALVAGLLFGLAGERWNDRGHLAKVAVHWVPFVCWTWVRWLDRPSRARGAALGAAILANLHSSVYQGLLLPVVLTPWALVLAWSGGWPRRRWLGGLGWLAGALAIGLVPFWVFVVVREEMDFVSSGATEVAGGWAWYLSPLLHPLDYARRWLTPDRAVTAWTPLPLLALVLAGVAARWRPSRPAPARERTHLLAALALTLAAIAVTLHSERLGPLGPAMDALFQLPGLNGLRGRSRLGIVATFGGAVVLGIALATILRRVRTPAVAAAVVALAAAAVVVDTRTFHAPTPLTWLPRATELPPAVALAVARDPAGGLLHVPYPRWPYEAMYMMWALHHDRPLMNGYTAVMPRFGPIVRAFPGDAARRALAEAGITHVIVHTPLMGGGNATWLEALRRRADVPQTEAGDAVLVTVEPPREPRRPLGGRALPHDGWTLAASDPGVEAAIDGDPATHWVARAIDRKTFLRIDLGALRRVHGVRLLLGPHLREYPHAWEIWTSDDGTEWTRAGGERPTPPPFASYRRDHRAIAVDLGFPPASVRFIEVRVPPQNAYVFFDQHAAGTWGVHELVVLGP